MATTNVIFRGSVETVKPVQSEALTATALPAGSLVFKNAGLFTLHATAGAGSETKLYLTDQNSLKQEDAATSVWASGDTAVAFEPRVGERYNARVATAQTLVVDSPLASNGDGTLRLGVPATDEILCYADQAITTSGVQLVAIKF